MLLKFKRLKYNINDTFDYTRKVLKVWNLDGEVMTIGMYGIHGTYNFGCEAIVRGAMQFIADVFPDAKVKYFSYSYDYDKTILGDLNIEIIPIKINITLFKRCINKILKIVNSEHRLFYFNSDYLLKDVDVLLSIGGDIYTIPSVDRNNKVYLYYNHLIDFCERCKLPVIVYGASVGPWGNYPKAINYYTKNMKKYRAIICREEYSIDYLNKLRFNNMVFFPDPAFQLGKGIQNKGEYIGINFSPLSLDEIYGKYDGNQIDVLAKLIDTIYDQFKRPIMFLPHVLSQSERDNDLWFMQKLIMLIKNRENVVLADTSSGFLGIKKSIRNCRFVVSARMHCAINALEENIPTILLSYSQKSIGMCKYVYGNKHWVVDIKKIKSELLNLMTEMDQKHDQIVDFLSVRNYQIKIDYLENLKKVKLMVNKQN